MQASIQLTLLAAGLLLLVLFGVTLLWRRFYRDDPTNAVRRIAKNSAVPLVSRMGVRVLDLVFAIILYGTLPGAEIGPYTLAALLVAQYLGTITEFGLGVLLTRDVARDPQAAPQRFGATLALRLILVVALAAPVAWLLVGIYDLLAQFGLGEAITPIGQQVIMILLLTLVPSAYSGAVTALYNAAERMEIPALVELITAIISLITRIVVLLLGFGILGLAWAAVGVSTFTACIYVALQVRQFFRPTLSFAAGPIRQLIPEAFPLMLNNLLSVVFFRFDTFIVKAFGGGQGDLLVQQYTIAYQVLGVALILPPVITFAVFPMLARRAVQDQGALAQAQNRTLQLLLVLALPIAATLTVLATELIRLFTRRNAAEYLPISAEVLAILAWFLPISFVNGLLQYVLIAVGRQQAITRAFIIGAIFNLSGNLIAIPSAASMFGFQQAGLYAAAGITILSEVVLLACFWKPLREAGLSPPLVSLAWRPVLATLGMGLVLLLVFSINPWVAAALGLPTYAAILWRTGAFGPEERALLRRLIRRS